MQDSKKVETQVSVESDEALGFRAALLQALAAKGPNAVHARPGSAARPMSPRTAWLPADQASMREQSLVRSIQRILTPPGLDATWVAGNYFR
ncbi:MULTISPECIES: hypothetical protein [Thiorhodovibrio]|uniref:hypothetical protein n=1 Tax=Thiorhodovibrio TaxID=61593 RepID=UPI001913093B|nr:MULTISPECIES: hypothetical protein [Thiorhodovibrio]MBK5967341.1 hypothetical protein [Thiorhodovibrio winogradskyi]WPL14869.1 hypothetical protein Thiosp_04725 [Thiorhodovibrio litoralis]